MLAQACLLTFHDGPGVGSNLVLFGNPEEGVPGRCRPKTAETVKALHEKVAGSTKAIGPQVWSQLSTTD